MVLIDICSDLALIFDLFIYYVEHVIRRIDPYALIVGITHNIWARLLLRWNLILVSTWKNFLPHMNQQLGTGFNVTICWNALSCLCSMASCLHVSWCGNVLHHFCRTAIMWALIGNFVSSFNRKLINLANRIVDWILASSCISTGTTAFPLIWSKLRKLSFSSWA